MNVTILLYIFIIFSNIWAYFSKTRIHRLVCVLSVLFCGFLFAYNANVADAQNYSYYYSIVTYRKPQSTEVTFYLINYVCYKLGLGVYAVRWTIYIIGVFFLGLLLKKTKTNPHVYIVLVLSCLFFIYNAQIRDFVAVAIVLYGFTFLLDDNPSYYKFVFFIVFASTFHSTALLYFPFVLARFKNKKFFLQITVICVVIFEVFILLNGRRIPFINFIVQVLMRDSVNNSRMIRYFNHATNGSLRIVLMYICNVVFVITCRRFITKANYEKESVRLANLIYYITLFQVVWIPMLWLSSEFYRFIRDILLFIYILYIHIIQRRNTGLHIIELERIKVNVIMLSNTTIWFIVNYYVVSDSSTLIYPTFFQNAIIR